MRQNWSHVIKVLFFIAILSAFAQGGLTEKKFDTNHATAIESEVNITMPNSLDFKIEEAKRLEVLRQHDPTAIEDLIDVYEGIIALLPPGDDLALKSSVQNKLGIAYRNRVLGNRADNIETAIHHFNNSLEVRTQESDPTKFAQTENNLGNAYLDRIKGNRADNIEIAIYHFNKSLEACTQKANPINCAGIENNLCIAYRDRIKGDRADNIEMAIEHCSNALKVRTRESNPENWAQTENNLGSAYLDRIKGDRADNIEIAIYNFNKSLEVRTREADPVGWALTEMNLGVAYGERIRGDRANNLEVAIEHFNNSLMVYAPDSDPANWAKAESNLGRAYVDRIKGNQADNIEMAIEYLNNALLVFTPDSDPANWAKTESNLGRAYVDRIKGNQADNIEMAIEHFNKSLMVYKPDSDPANWAWIENDLGSAYLNRIKGNQADNIEMAIRHLNKSLEVRTREADPVGWALTEMNLGVAYGERIRGDRANNLEIAIEHHNNSLMVYAPDSDPAGWANIEISLGVAYGERIRGDRANNLEMAIEHFNNALMVYTLDSDPVRWANAESNLGIAYLDRIKGYQADNVEMAIKHFNNALMVYKPDSDPANWAWIESNLGSAYGGRIRVDRAANIEMAIEHFNNALKVQTRESNPENWAKTENNLGNAYLDRIKGYQADNIEMAIEHFNNALMVFTPDSDPVRWAKAENNLGSAYQGRINGDRAANIEMAIKHYQKALQICTANSLPRDFRDIERNLGNLYFGQSRWQEALDAYNNAIAAGDLLYRSGLTIESKSNEIKDNSLFYRNAAFAAVHLNKTNEALLIMEHGKTRFLIEELRLKTQRPSGVPDVVWKRYEQAAKTYRNLQLSPIPRNYTVQSLRERELKSREAINSLNETTKEIQRIVPGFQKDMDISDVQNILDENTALLSFCVTNKGSIALVLSQNTDVQAVDIPGFNTTDLDQLIFGNNTNDQGNITGNWLSIIDGSSGPTGSKKIINLILNDLSKKLVHPTIGKLPKKAKNLIILPSGNLVLLPIHAVPLSDDEYLSDRYCINYAPSLPVLIDAKNKAKRSNGNDLYALINPTNDAEICDAKAIFRLFSNSSIDEGTKGTKDAVMKGINGHAYIHFYCHGYYDLYNPSRSGLKLANDTMLTLADLQSWERNLSTTKLVTLSACESGISDVIYRNPEEFVGLPAGFMQAGVPCVIGSLWAVNTIATSMLMERFYANHIEKGMDIPQALQEAQKWLRVLNETEIKGYQAKHCSGNPDILRGDRPYEDPYYWAAFTVNGE